MDLNFGINTFMPQYFVLNDQQQQQLKLYVDHIRTYSLASSSKNIKKKQIHEKLKYISLQAAFQPQKFLNPYNCFMVSPEIPLTLKDSELCGFGKIYTYCHNWSKKIVSINNLIQQKFIQINLESIKFDLTPLSYVKNQLENSQDQDYKRISQNLENIANQRKLVIGIEKGNLQSQLQQIQKPSIVMIFRKLEDRCKLVRMLFNYSYLELLGINSLMFIDFVQKEKVIPGFLAKNAYQKFWTDWLQTWVKSQESIIEANCQTYEGIIVSLKINYKSKAIQDQHSNNIYNLDIYEFQVPEYLNQSLLNPQRIAKNSKEYFISENYIMQNYSRVESFEKQMIIEQNNNSIPINNQEKFKKQCGFKPIQKCDF